MSALPNPYLLADEDWPAEIAFLPYIGDRYWQGVDGQRVLLLGESHYRTEGWTNDPDFTRRFTRDTFADLATLERRPGGGRFFGPIDRILVGKAEFPDREAIDAWRHVSFVNLSQQFAGSAARQRPTGEQLRRGGDILVRSILPILRPAVVLVLGRTAWRAFNDGQPAPELPAFVASQVNRTGRKRRYIEDREVWRLGYEGGTAVMTWVYHPSWHVDSWQDRAGALRHLLAIQRSAI